MGLKLVEGLRCCHSDGMLYCFRMAVAARAIHWSRGRLAMALILAFLLGGFVWDRLKSGLSASKDAAGRSEQAAFRPGSEGEQERAAPETKAGKRNTPSIVMKSGPEYHTFDEQGLVNEELLVLAGIPVERRPEVKAIMDGIWADLSADFQGRAVFVPEKSNEEAGVKTYLVPARPETVKAAADKLRAKLTESFGESPARELAPYLMRPDFFAGFGVNDLEINVSSSKVGHGDLIRTYANFNVIDPVTGGLLSTHKIGAQTPYRQYLGNFMEDEISSKLNP